MRSKLIIANWKLNGNWSFNEEFASALSQGLKGIDLNDRQIVICPPSIFLQQLGGLIIDQAIYLGGQDLSDEVSGPFTGEISGAMLKEFGCRFVIVGHSERRSRHAETNELVVKKAIKAIAAGLTPVVCIGETLEQRQGGHMQSVLAGQIDSLLSGVDQLMSQVVIAYEPVWAIGTGVGASPAQAQEVHAYVRKWIIDNVGAGIADKVRILYGGSVNDANCEELAQQEDVDGFLVGGASLKGSSFVKICNASKAIATA